MIDAAPTAPDGTPTPAVAKAALYLRVSTGRQAESNLSIPDQRRRITAYCVAKGWDVAAEQRGAKIKKKLEIDPLHADTVRLIYRLFLEGDGVKGPMGVKAITCYLNERRLFTRDGGRWGLAQIHAILTGTTYTCARHQRP
ncbi:hypothetical protein ACG33_11450 [Steroidobacter denitrificans]|uniref:Recombinase domain-containing protein n=1 Tax=Steroidobacter denitrificans TaxID=465721 RepID=A0A127FBA2_STEDE|nr:recombinase family protein [Steroidobacter denitrificans]AMN47704.1 hypothetical protein ACG33_11450 [Steroidobacter denitrificans]